MVCLSLELCSVLTKHVNVFTGKGSLASLVKDPPHPPPLWAILSSPLTDQRSTLGRVETLTLGVCVCARWQSRRPSDVNHRDSVRLQAFPCTLTKQRRRLFAHLACRMFTSVSSSWVFFFPVSFTRGIRGWTRFRESHDYSCPT